MLLQVCCFSKKSQINLKYIIDQEKVLELCNWLAMCYFVILL